MDKVRCWLFIICMVASGVQAQDTDSLFAPADTTFSASDSLNIFNLIDSLLNNSEVSGSQLALRLSYNSNVLSAGRTLGIENFGLAPGISYYHSSGFYGDVSGYWSKDFEPAYYLTIVSLGYMKDFSKRFSLMAGYDRYLYSIGEDYYIPFKNTFYITPILEFKPISLTGNYSFYSGDETAHRIMPGLSVTLQKRKFRKIDRVALIPSFFILFGNQVVTTHKYFETRRGTITIETSKNVFGVMNYAISVPLSINIDHWSFSFTYAYSIPKALPGETLTFSESTYLSASLTYFIEL
jgi:hypothetical protein